jgi:hypothetical protein
MYFVKNPSTSRLQTHHHAQQTNECSSAVQRRRQASAADALHCIPALRCSNMIIGPLSCVGAAVQSL